MLDEAKHPMKIDKKITGYEVVKDNIKNEIVLEQPEPKPYKRPESLSGSTYKIKPPAANASYYITINDDGFSPLELFINSKNVDHYQWIAALSRVISAIFRKGGDMEFLVDELKAIHDPTGSGYFQNGKYHPSIVAAIGYMIEKHLDTLSLTTDTQTKPKDDFPAEATLCKQCNYKAVITLDKCPTCLNCGDAKCG